MGVLSKPLAPSASPAREQVELCMAEVLTHIEQDKFFPCRIDASTATDGPGAEAPDQEATTANTTLARQSSLPPP